MSIFSVELLLDNFKIFLISWVNKVIKSLIILNKIQFFKLWISVKVNLFCSNSFWNSLDKSNNSKQIKNFVMYYERLTKHMLKTLPKTADTVIGIDKKHRLKSIKFN